MSEKTKGSIFSYKNYRDYIRADIASHKGERGYQKKLATAAQCRPSYLSQVLNSHIQLTLDQAAGLCEFWSFNDDRTEYFLSLVQHDRASASSLKKFLAKKLTQLQKKHQQVSEMISAKERVTIGDERIAYYTNWLLPAVHVLTSVPAYQKTESLADKLRIPGELLLTVLDELKSMGFISEKSGRFKSVVHNIHVNRESSLNIAHHSQWRQRAMGKIVERDPRNIHYTTLYGISHKDADILRGMLLEFIENSRKLVEPSAEEDVVCLLADLFYL